MENREHRPKGIEGTIQPKRLAKEAEDEFQSKPEAKGNFEKFLSREMSDDDYLMTLLSPEQRERFAKVEARRLAKTNEQATKEIQSEETDDDGSQEK